MVAGRPSRRPCGGGHHDYPSTDPIAWLRIPCDFAQSTPPANIVRVMRVIGPGQTVEFAASNGEIEQLTTPPSSRSGDAGYDRGITA